MNILVTVLVINNLLFQCEVSETLAKSIIIDYSLENNACALHLPDEIKYIPATITVIEAGISI